MLGTSQPLAVRSRAVALMSVIAVCLLESKLSADNNATDIPARSFRENFVM